ncbi:MAG: energy transducer TonB [Reichenbachiella sp.]|uniref:energy transducer TonB n=1 Tax=Reichenbachiella sp. TaxID=2184521 RepID=UPI003266A9A5
MELRKNPKIDLEKKRSAFFNIGLAISLVLVTSAFEWKFYDDGKFVVLDEPDSDFDELIDLPPTVHPIPPPPVVVLPKIIEIEDEVEIIEQVKVIIDTEVSEDDIIEALVFDEPIEDEETDEIIDIVEVNPAPLGGMNAFYKYVSKNMRYPSQARKMGIEGRVFVQFVVDQNGKLIMVKAIKGIGGGCDEEAVRVISNAAPWSPGKQRGRPVKVRMVLPVTFRLK